MKILSDVKGYIEREYGTYSKDMVFASYIGDDRNHLYVNFAPEDEIIKSILREYSSANAIGKVQLELAYDKRVKELVKDEEFSVIRVEKHRKIPCVEVAKKVVPGYLIGTFCQDIEKFVNFGSIVYIPKKYMSSIKCIQRVESGFGNHKRVAGFFYMANEEHNFRFYMVTREKNSDGLYYVEEVAIDYANNCCKFTCDYFNQRELEILKKDLKRF